MIFARCNDSATGGIDENVALFDLYYHCIEMLDGIQILVLQAVVTPAKPLLRSLFEAKLAIAFILKDGADHANRALAWIYDTFKDKLKEAQNFD